jgi:vacuolar-type H+-ATPase subunit I/STV1
MSVHPHACAARVRRVRRVCGGQFGARTALLNEVQTRIADLQSVMDHASRHRADRLAELARMLPDWRTVALKQKAVYRILNMWNYGDLT